LQYANIVVTHSINNGIEIPLKSKIGGTSDLDGNYMILSVPDGRFIVKVIYVGYREQTFKVSLGGTNRNARHDVSLKSYSRNLEEVVVTRQAKGQMAAINQQLSSIAITNVVASDRIRQNPDANAAEAIGRLPGITVTRSGGEASNIIIRGMPSNYNNVTLNGIELPSAIGDSRSASLSGISQYSLQGIEVYKSITPDMDANSVAGTVNMILKTAPDSFNCNIMIQGGYNAQNNDFKNYKLAFEMGDRFFQNRLGIELNLSSERTNRSTQKLDASYDWESGVRPEGEYVPLYNTYIGLTDVSRIVNRNSGTLVLDYRFSPGSTIQFSNFFASNPQNDGKIISKTYLPLTGEVFYNVDQIIAGRTNVYSGTILGAQIIGKLKINYGGSYTISNNCSEIRNVDVRSYQGFYKGILDQIDRSKPLAEILRMANNEQTQENLRTYGLGGRSVIAPNFQKNLNEQNEAQYEAHIDLIRSFQITDAILLELKMGGQYKHKDRNRDFDLVVWHSNVFQDFITGKRTTGDGINWIEGLEWITLNDNSAVSMENMVGGSIDNFLGGEYIFGWYPDVNKINKIYDYWIPMMDYYRAQGPKVWGPLFGFEIAMGNILPRPSVAHDYSINQNYYAGYVMPTFSIGNKITLLPGFRYEKVNADMKSWYVEHRLNETMEIPGYETFANRKNDYFLPMIHLKYKALQSLQFQWSFTQTLNRPLFNMIVPYVYVDNANTSYKYESGNPQLRPELWTNYDINIAFHNKKVGLFSINGYYKKAKDKIWNRTWTRLAEDEPIPPFSEFDVVDVTGYYNHKYNVTVKGFEVEWQTNFWYLPKPFNFFTLSLNYSYINNKTKYPWEEVNLVSVDTTDAGRVIYNKIRVDSAFAGPMINQPSHLANASLGFSYKGFDSWISFQYISDIPISLSGAVEKHVYKIAFVRWDFQSRLILPVKGLELLFSIANINNKQEEQYMKGDPRPIHVERYGWTSDFGIRYTF
jgi:TonB-dependent receptor